MWTKAHKGRVGAKKLHFLGVLQECLLSNHLNFDSMDSDSEFQGAGPMMRKHTHLTQNCSVNADLIDVAA